MRKRPRVEQAGATGAALAPRLRAQGMVVVQRLGVSVPLRSLVQQGVHLALASGRGAGLFEVLAWATSPERGAEALTMEEAVTAFTQGAAYAEFTSASPDQLRRARGVLTVIASRSVHDVP